MSRKIIGFISLSRRLFFALRTGSSASKRVRN
jgi:hypothetical protein